MRHQVQVARHAIALEDDVARPFGEVGLALDDPRGYTLCESLCSGLVAGAGVKARLISDGHGLAFDGDRLCALNNGVGKTGVGVGDDDGAGRRRGRAPARVWHGTGRSTAGADCFAGDLLTVGVYVGRRHEDLVTEKTLSAILVRQGRR